MEENREVTHATNDKAAQYLNATIQTAEWISKPYKNLAEANKNNPIIVRELYMCFADRVPADLLAIALQDNKPESALKRCRKNYIADSLQKEQTRELEKLSYRLADLEENINNITKILTGNITITHEIKKDESNNINAEVSDSEEKKSELNKNEASESTESNNEEKPVLEDLKKKTFRDKAETLFSRFKQKPSSYVVGLMERGYTTEQIEYMLNCVAEGLTKDEIESFSDPKLPVSVMNKLKEMHVKSKEK